MTALLLDGEPHPAFLTNSGGASPFVLICEHASHSIPASLGGLGVAPENIVKHIGWDIGAAEVAKILSKVLDATLIVQNYSRLVYDCNRPPEAQSAMPEVSEIYEIPGNKNLGANDRRARVQEIYRPFHHTIEACLDERAISGRLTIPISIHSFNPTYHGKPRNFDIGFLFDRDNWLANFLVKAFPSDKARLNEPYGPKDGVMHLMNLHAFPRGLKHVMIEIRNDLITTAKNQNLWANYLSVPLAQAASVLTNEALAKLNQGSQK
jgi:predicted N-formylglutamate amidohydrolase